MSEAVKQALFSGPERQNRKSYHRFVPKEGQEEHKPCFNMTTSAGTNSKSGLSRSRTSRRSLTNTPKKTHRKSIQLLKGPDGKQGQKKTVRGVLFEFTQLLDEFRKLIQHIEKEVGRSINNSFKKFETQLTSFLFTDRSAGHTATLRFPEYTQQHSKQQRTIRGDSGHRRKSKTIGGYQEHIRKDSGHSQAIRKDLEHRKNSKIIEGDQEHIKRDSGHRKNSKTIGEDQEHIRRDLEHRENKKTIGEDKEHIRRDLEHRENKKTIGEDKEHIRRDSGHSQAIGGDSFDIKTIKRGESGHSKVMAGGWIDGDSREWKQWSIPQTQSETNEEQKFNFLKVENPKRHERVNSAFSQQIRLRDKILQGAESKVDKKTKLREEIESSESQVLIMMGSSDRIEDIRSVDTPSFTKNNLQPSLKDAQQPSLKDAQQPSLKDALQPSLRDAQQPSLRDAQQPSLKDVWSPLEEEPSMREGVGVGESRERSASKEVEKLRGRLRKLRGMLES